MPTAAEIILLARERLDDLAQPYLWTDNLLLAYLNDAQMEASRRAALLVDGTGSIAKITVKAGTASYKLDPRVIRVQRVRMAGRTLLPARIEELDAMGDWESATGEPTHYVLNGDSRHITLYPSPDADGLINMTLQREPLDAMTMGDEPEIAPRYHMALASFIAGRAYAKQDIETQDIKKSATAMAEFDLEFGNKNQATAAEDAWNRDQYPSAHQFNGVYN